MKENKINKENKMSYKIMTKITANLTSIAETHAR
jgi:hypothetical protein